MVVHKKVAKAVKKVGKKVVRKALKFVGVRIRKPAKRMRAPMKKRLRRPRHVGPPKVGFRTVKGRGGRRITIKRPSPRIVGPTESQAIGKSPKRRTGRRIA